MFGPAVINCSFKIDELHALLVNADPQGGVPKPNKTVGLQTVINLEIVKSALRRHATTITLQAPAIMQALSPPTFSEGVNRPSFGSVGSSDVLLRSYAPIASFGPIYVIGTTEAPEK